MSLDRGLARRIIESVGSSGTPPEAGLHHFTVGLGPYLNAIREEYLADFIRRGGAAFKLVVGPFGGGKTHFLYCVRDIAWQENFCVSYVALTPTETPFHSMHLVYRALATALSFPPDREASPEAGIDAVLRRWFLQRSEEFASKGLAGRELEAALERVAAGVRGLESTAFSKAVRGAFQALARDDEEAFETLVQYLRGENEDFDRKTYGAFGIHEGIHRASAPRMIRSLACWIRQIGYSGLVILFDEAELTPSFSRKQKEILVNNLRELIDRCCQGSFRNVMVFYAVPDERSLEGRGTAYEALKQRLWTVFDVPNPTGVKLYLEQISKDPVGLLTEIGVRLAAVYEVAMGVELDRGPLLQGIKSVAAECYEDRFADISHRRRFVQFAVELLRMAHRGENVALSREEARALIRRRGVGG